MRWAHVAHTTSSQCAQRDPSRSWLGLIRLPPRYRARKRQTTIDVNTAPYKILNARSPCVQHSVTCLVTVIPESRSMLAARRVAVAGAHTPGRTCDGSSRLRRKGGGRHRFSVSTRSRVDAIVLAVDRKLRRQGDQASKVTVSPDVTVSPKAHDPG